MGGRWSRRGLLALLASSAGCLGGTRTPTHSPTAAGTDRTPTATARDTPTDTPSPEPVAVREWPDGYYRGPMVSAHEHMHGADGYSVVEEDLEWYLRWMDRNRMDQVVGFASDRYLDRMLEHDDRFLPFAFGHAEIEHEFDDLVGAFERRVDDLPYVGIGELGFKPRLTPEGEPPPRPDAPSALELWDWAAENDLVVMAHGAEPGRYPDDVWHRWSEYDDCPMKHQLDAAMAHNRDTRWLVHATYQWYDTPNGQLVAEALEENPNLTYDVSMLHPLGYGEGVLDERPFERRLEELGGPEGVAERFYEEYRVVLEEYSHRLTWGMDASSRWHYTDHVLDAWVDCGRALLGMLPEDNARNIAYRTAADLFDVEVAEGG
jgi:hypothetical protein